MADGCDQPHLHRLTQHDADAPVKLPRPAAEQPNRGQAGAVSDSDRTANTAAFFDGARLTLARHLAGLRKSDLAALIKKSPTADAT